ncbi:MAG: dTDP-4-dehydrorhamnose reductase [Alphaproteobacteria bacterium]|nr:MAG: dTDP-4-dehydrorhamnose reductase [Alphaproteobacteria bacterium]
MTERMAGPVLVFGRTGQLARELARHDRVLCLGRDAADLADPAAAAARIAEIRPSAVINAAAHTDVDGAEAAEALAMRINAEAPAALARAAAALDIPFVTVSTDYVFDGTGTRPWRPDDPPAPLGAYGRSKLAGERAVARAGGRWAVLRTSWVVSAHGRNFIRTMLRLGRERGAVRVVADQIGAPTPAAALAQACLVVARTLAVRPERAGLYHFAGTPDTSWADFARAIFAAAGMAVEVTDIATADWPTPARRPLNSRLDCTATTAAFGLARPDWRAALPDILTEIGANP